MTEDNQHNADGQQTPMQPQPLPGQVFVRPGIDDRPDYEKTLTEEAKAALKRLAVQQNPRVPEASNERPEVQQTLINTAVLMRVCCTSGRSLEASGTRGFCCTARRFRAALASSVSVFS